MGEQGSVAWMFERKSQIFVPGDKATEDQLMGIVLDAGADDLRNDGDQLGGPLRSRSARGRAQGAGCQRHSRTRMPASPWFPRT